MNCLAAGGLQLGVPFNVDNDEILSEDELGSAAGRVIVICGRFGTGKTTLALTIAAEVANKGGVGWVIPTEQTPGGLQALP